MLTLWSANIKAYLLLSVITVSVCVIKLYTEVYIYTFCCFFASSWKYYYTDIHKSFCQFGGIGGGTNGGTVKDCYKCGETGDTFSSNSSQCVDPTTEADFPMEECSGSCFVSLVK